MMVRAETSLGLSKDLKRPNRSATAYLSSLSCADKAISKSRETSQSGRVYVQYEHIVIAVMVDLHQDDLNRLVTIFHTKSKLPVD